MRMLIEIPKQSGKTGMLQLSDLPQVNYDSDKSLSNRRAIYSFERDKFKYEFILSKNLERSDRLFILFSGDAVRSQYDPPIFQRWSWADKFPGHCLYISDPSLHLHSRLGLAWYAGTKKHEPMQVISELVSEIAQKLEVDVSKVISYGSSGGGFAALRFGAFHRGSSVVTVNPQTDVTKYDITKVTRYLKICFKVDDFDLALKTWPEKLSILNLADKLIDTKIVYIQNRLDDRHYGIHFLPFAEKMGLSESNGFESEKIKTIIFEHEGGHTKAETSEVFTQAMSIVTSW